MALASESVLPRESRVREVLSLARCASAATDRRELSLPSL